jgi:tetratricopeptide (TPR) repeat protein
LTCAFPGLDGPFLAPISEGMACRFSIGKRCHAGETRWATSVLRALALFLSGAAFLCFNARAQKQPEEAWQAQVRKYSDARDWTNALRIVDEQMASSPQDMDILAWRARVLTWAGRLAEAEQDFNMVLRVEKNDPDNWMGLANLYMRQGRMEEALKTADRAVELDPNRGDLRSARAQILRASGSLSDARLEFMRALVLDPSDVDARAGIFSLRDEGKQELRFGFDEDMFSFSPSNYDQWVSLVSKWTPQWTTSVAGSFYQRDSIDAGEFVGSVTRTQPHWGALTVGGATGHDNGVIPKTEAFFELDHGFKISENKPLRGLELTYGQHWYWYSLARILTVNERALVYLPHDWTWSIELIEARSHFPGTNADWKPSGVTRLGFPLDHWSRRELSGNVFYAVGTEDFAQIDQIGSFASQTYGGGLRFRFTPRQDVTGYAAFQQRTQNRAQTSFGISYGIRF